MEEVIIYTRVSTDEQAEKGYSLRAQLERLNQYCEFHHQAIVHHFQEDFSAKTFDRPEFNRLLAYLKQNKHIRKLLFVKWDRFSRNLEGALTMIRHLKKMNVEPIAVDQYIDLSIPEQKMTLAVYLTAPEIENDRRSLNTTQGMRRAMREGRWVSGAPVGYRNTRDDKNKPIIVPSDQAPFVQQAFELCASGRYHIEEVRRIMQAKGMQTSRNGFWSMLRNVTYLGMIRIKAHEDEPETIVRGIHPPLISEDIFEKVQQFMDRRKRSERAFFQNISEDFPLRGLLYCPECGRKLYASKSVSKTKAKHAYYHCSLGCKFRCRVADAEKELRLMLKDIELSPEWKEAIQKDYLRRRNVQQADVIEQRKLYQERLQTAEMMLLKIDEKYLGDEIDKETYQRMMSTKKEEIEGLKAALSLYGNSTRPYRKDFELGLEIMANFSEIYSSASLQDKRYLLSSSFSENLIFEKPKYRTPKNTPLMDIICGISAKFEGFENKKTGSKTGFSCVVARRGIEPLFQE